MFRKELVSGILLVLVLFGTSCRSLRISTSKEETETREINSVRLIGEVKKNNIINSAISISKIVINYSGGGENRRLRANLKSDGKGQMLISIRTIAGIEAARILVTGDSVHVADKLNRIYYRGRIEKVAVKYGISYDLINLLFGDFNEDVNIARRVRCVKGKAMVTDEKNNIEYTFDCGVYKLVEARGGINRMHDTYKGTFGEFKKEDGMIYPGEIIWQLEGGSTRLELTLDNFKKRNDNELVFTNVDNYEVRIIK